MCLFELALVYPSANTDLHAYADDFFSSSSVLLSFVICKSYVNKSFFGIFWKCGDVCNLYFFRVRPKKYLFHIKFKAIASPVIRGFFLFVCFVSSNTFLLRKYWYILAFSPYNSTDKSF